MIAGSVGHCKGLSSRSARHTFDYRKKKFPFVKVFPTVRPPNRPDSARARESLTGATTTAGSGFRVDEGKPKTAERPDRVAPVYRRRAAEPAFHHNAEFLARGSASELDIVSARPTVATRLGCIVGVDFPVGWGDIFFYTAGVAIQGR